MLNGSRISRFNGIFHKLCVLNGASSYGRARKSYSTAAAVIPSFKDVMHERKLETKRSVIVKVDSLDSKNDIYHHCKQYGEIKTAIAYTMKEDQHHVLLEYENEDSVRDIFKNSGFLDNAVPWPNQYLTLNKSALKQTDSKDAPIQLSALEAPSIVNILKEAESIDEQISLLYETARLNDLSIRLRFMGATQTQRILNHFLGYVFPDANIYPFGSSLNGFGRMGCDLDMVLRFKEDDRALTVNPDAPLEFLGKEHPIEATEDSTTLGGRRIKCIGSFLDYYLPGLDKMSAYVNARVPIVRYTDTNIDNVIDLSVNNLDSFQITELMYTFGTLDPRVRPFVFLCRTWEKEFKERQFNSREFLTNFQLTYMALSFLQHLKDPVLPTYDQIMEQLTGNNPEQANALVNKDFMFDRNCIQFKSNNVSTVHELFCQFLEYYSEFNFAENMISLRTTEKLSKVEEWPLCLDNVFVKDAAWGDTVTEFECSYFKLKAKEALNELNQSQQRTNDEPWGLLKAMPLLK